MRDWLVGKRTNANMTQDEVANNAGIARTTYAMIEQNKRNPSVSVAKKIASTLCFDWTIFFDTKCHDSRIGEAREAI